MNINEAMQYAERAKGPNYVPTLVVECCTVLAAQVAQLQNKLNAACHVIVEHGIVPGLDHTCRCDDCRSVAESMDEAHYLDLIRDRWWDTAAKEKQ